jgi:hypothetical protein
MHSEMKGRPVANSHYVRQPMGIVLAGCLRGLAERLAQQVVARFRCNRDELIRVFGLPDRVIAVVVFRPAGAATLLASVEPRSTPDGCVLVSPPRHRPARPGGAVFNTASPVASLGEPRPSALNIAPRWQAAWWRGRSIRWDAVLVLNIARRRQAPPWRSTLRSPDPSVGQRCGGSLRWASLKLSRADDGLPCSCDWQHALRHGWILP